MKQNKLQSGGVKLSLILALTVLPQIPAHAAVFFNFVDGSVFDNAGLVALADDDAVAIRLAGEYEHISVDRTAWSDELTGDAVVLGSLVIAATGVENGGVFVVAIFADRRSAGVGFDIAFAAHEFRGVGQSSIDIGVGRVCGGTRDESENERKSQAHGEVSLWPVMLARASTSKGRI